MQEEAMGAAVMLATLEENSPFISKAFHRKERASWEI